MNKNRDPHRFAEILQRFIGTTAEKIEWEAFYRDHFDLDVDFTNVLVPEADDQTLRAQFMPSLSELSHNRILYVMEKSFSVSIYDGQIDLDKCVTKNSRNGIMSYAIRESGEVMPDLKYFSKSAEEADPNGVIGMNMREAMVLIYKTIVDGKRLQGFTLCTGSRDDNGRVPCLNFDYTYKVLRVDFYSLDFLNPNAGLREVVE